MTDLADLTIDEDELQRHIDELGEIGLHPAGGLYRGLYSPSWREAVDRMAFWFEDSGLAVRRDAVGNLFGRTSGGDTAGVVLTGSHIDTVKQGGKYDGALGIHAALAATKALVATCGPPRRPIEVLAICTEEQSRFPDDFWGTRAILGLLEADEPQRIADGDGVTLAEAMRDCGLDPARVSAAARDDIAAFIELHIEQGAILDAGGHDIGVVDTITGQRHLHVQVSGRQDHAGTTPMDLRRDPMAGAAEMIVRITDMAARFGRPAVATVGVVSTSPGAVNIVPGEARFSVDTRHSVPSVRQTMLTEIQSIIDDVARTRNVAATVRQSIDHDPVPLDPTLRDFIAAAAEAEKLDHISMPSGAGHDSQMFAQHVPTGMIFVPSSDGRSHTPAEHTPIERVIPGVKVLARVLHRLAYGVAS